MPDLPPLQALIWLSSCYVPVRDIAGVGSDILIQDSDRAPIDNRQSVTMQADQGNDSSNVGLDKLTVVKKKHRYKKVTLHKDKWSKGQDGEPATSSGRGPNAIPVSGNPDEATLGEEVVIPPEILRAIKSSLRDDPFQICPQACKQAMDTKDMCPLPP